MRYEEEKTLRPALVVGFSIFLVALFVVSFSTLSTSPYVELFATASVGPNTDSAKPEQNATSADGSGRFSPANGGNKRPPRLHPQRSAT